MVHLWYKTTDKLHSYARVVILDFRKALNLINHQLFLEKMHMYGLSCRTVKWMATFLLDNTP